MCPTDAGRRSAGVVRHAGAAEACACVPLMQAGAGQVWYIAQVVQRGLRTGLDVARRHSALSAGACADVSMVPGGTAHLPRQCRSHAAGGLLPGQVRQGGAARLGLGQAERGGGVAGGGNGGPKAVPRGAGVCRRPASSPLHGRNWSARRSCRRLGGCVPMWNGAERHCQGCSRDILEQSAV